MSSPLVSAIVLNYRSPVDAVRCVASLRAQTIADQMEVLVIDNHSLDESIGTFRARLKGKTAARILEHRTNAGFGGGNNVAVQHAKGEYILFVNPDNILPADAVEHMLKALKADPNGGIIGPALVYPSGLLRPSARRFPTVRDLFYKRVLPTRWHERYAKEIQDGTGGVREVDWLVGACLLMRRDLFETLGGFDERFFLFFEDIDLCRRCRNAGKKVLYDTSVRVLDRERRLSGHGAVSLLTNRTTRIHVMSAMKYFWKWRNA